MLPSPTHTRLPLSSPSPLTAPQAHQSYLESTQSRSAAFKALTASDTASAHAIEQRMKKLTQMQVCAAGWWRGMCRGRCSQGVLDGGWGWL